MSACPVSLSHFQQGATGIFSPHGLQRRPAGATFDGRARRNRRGTRNRSIELETFLTLRPAIAALLAAVTIGLAAPLAAQETTITPSVIVAEDVSDAQIAAFVDVLMAVEVVRKDFAGKLNAEQDPDARQKLVDEANAAAMQAVDSVEGMTAADYLGIGKAASGNKDLNDRIAARYEEKLAE